MKAVLYSILLIGACALGGCRTLSQASAETNENTRKVALLIQSLNDSTAAFQRQRDAIALASMAQRQALESSALRGETAVHQATAAWDVAGFSERSHSFTALRESSANLLARVSEQRARELAHARELREARSAVRFQNAKLSEATLTLMQLAEPSDAEQARFYLAYARALREAIRQDGEAEAAKLTEHAKKGKDHE